MLGEAMEKLTTELSSQPFEDKAIPTGYSPELSDDDILYLNDYFTTMRHNPSATSTLICKGTQCEVYKHCPLAQLRKQLPISQPCPVERQLIEIWTRDLMQELDVDLDAHVDRAQVAELVRNRLMIKRTQEILADSTAIVESFKGFDPEGNPLVEPKLHPLLPVFEKTSKISEKIMDSLIATREAKSRDKSREVTTAANFAAQIMHKMQNIEMGEPRHLTDARGNLKEEEQKRIEVVDVSFEPVNTDTVSSKSANEDI